MSNPESRLEARRWVDVADKLLEARDLHGSRRFAKRAQETDPQIDGPDQIIAIIDVLLAAEKRIHNTHLDWYALLQLDRRDVDVDLIKRQYKKLALLLHPDKNKFYLAGNAFKLLCDAWGCLSDSLKRSAYDTQTSFFLDYDHPIVFNNHPKPKPPPPQPKKKKKKRKSAPPAVEDSILLSTFWTLCPYCYYLYEYPRLYQDSCLRCQNCRRPFHGAAVHSPPPPLAQLNDFYYCTWAFFPVGCTMDNDLVNNKTWMPFTPVFSSPSQQNGEPITGKTKDPTDSGVQHFVDTRAGIQTDPNNLLKKQTSISFQVEGTDVGMSVQDESGVSQKAMRLKTTARKSVLSKPNNLVTKTTTTKSTAPKLTNQKITQLHSEMIGEKIVPEWIGMDLNLKVSETEETNKADAFGVEIQGIDNEATEGIGFFEGLDNLLGNIAPEDPSC